MTEPRDQVFTAKEAYDLGMFAGQRVGSRATSRAFLALIGIAYVLLIGLGLLIWSSSQARINGAISERKQLQVELVKGCADSNAVINSQIQLWTTQIGIETHNSFVNKSVRTARIAAYTAAIAVVREHLVDCSAYAPRD